MLNLNFSSSLERKEGQEYINEGPLKNEGAFRCPECNRGVRRYKDGFVCPVHGMIYSPVDLRDIEENPKVRERFYNLYLGMLEEAREEDFNTVKEFVEDMGPLYGYYLFLKRLEDYFNKNRAKT